MIFFPGEQATLAAPVRLEGTGIHTGEKCAISVHEGPPGSGIVFRSRRTTIPATPSNVVDTSRGTTLGADGCRVVCVEHTMAALAGLGIDNAVCEVSGPEIPIGDGSARLFADELRKVGRTPQGRERRTYDVPRMLCVSRGEAVLTGASAERFQVEYLLRYSHPLIGVSHGSFPGGREEFSDDIAPARTFGLASEVEELRKRGLARGASTQNAVVVFDGEVQPELRFPDEFVRHKLLDMLGDLALTGGAVLGAFYGVITGHWANVEMARRIRKE